MVAIAALAPTMAIGAQASGTLSVSATVLSSCTVSALPLAFGSYTPAVGELTGTTTIAVLCTLSTPYHVRLGTGQNSSDVAERKMKIAAGADTLSYALYRDAGRTNNWGQTNGTDAMSGTGSGLLQNISVYGAIPANQFVPAGVYADSVTITVDY